MALTTVPSGGRLVLCDLHKDLLCSVCNFLEMREIFIFGRTCKMINKISKDPSSAYRLGTHLYGKTVDFWFRSLISKRLELFPTKKNDQEEQPSVTDNDSNDNKDDIDPLHQFMWAKQLIVNFDVFECNKNNERKEIENQLLSCFEKFNKLQVLMIANEWSQNHISLKKLMLKQMFPKQKNLKVFVMQECGDSGTFMSVELLNSIVDENFKHKLKYIDFGFAKIIDFQRLYEISLEYKGLNTIYIDVSRLVPSNMDDNTYDSKLYYKIMRAGLPSMESDQLFHIDLEYYHNKKIALKCKDLNNNNYNNNNKGSSSENKQQTQIIKTVATGQKSQTKETDGDSKQEKNNEEENDTSTDVTYIPVSDRIVAWNKLVFSHYPNIIISLLKFTSHLVCNQRYYYEHFYYFHKNLRSFHISLPKSIRIGSNNEYETFVLQGKKFMQQVTDELKLAKVECLRFMFDRRVQLFELEELCVRVRDKYRLHHVFVDMIKKAPNLKKLFLWVDSEYFPNENNNNSNNSNNSNNNNASDDGKFRFSLSNKDIEQCLNTLLDDSDSDGDKTDEDVDSKMLSKLETFYFDFNIWNHEIQTRENGIEQMRIYNDFVCKLGKKYNVLRETGINIHGFLGKKITESEEQINYNDDDNTFDCLDCFLASQSIFDEIYNKQIKLNRFFCKLKLRPTETFDNKIDLKEHLNLRSTVLDEVLKNGENKAIYEKIFDRNKCEFNMFEHAWYRNYIRWTFDFRFNSDVAVEDACSWICECSLCNISTIASRGRLNVQNPLIG